MPEEQRPQDPKPVAKQGTATSTKRGGKRKKNAWEGGVEGYSLEQTRGSMGKSQLELHCGRFTTQQATNKKGRFLQEAASRTSDKITSELQPPNKNSVFLKSSHELLQPTQYHTIPAAPRVTQQHQAATSTARSSSVAHILHGGTPASTFFLQQQQSRKDQLLVGENGASQGSSIIRYLFENQRSSSIPPVQRPAEYPPPTNLGCLPSFANGQHPIRGVNPISFLGNIQTGSSSSSSNTSVEATSQLASILSASSSSTNNVPSVDAAKSQLSSMLASYQAARRRPLSLLESMLGNNQVSNNSLGGSFLRHESPATQLHNVASMDAARKRPSNFNSAAALQETRAAGGAHHLPGALSASHNLNAAALLARQQPECLQLAMPTTTPTQQQQQQQKPFQQQEIQRQKVQQRNIILSQLLQELLANNNASKAVASTQHQQMTLEQWNNTGGVQHQQPQHQRRPQVRLSRKLSRIEPIRLEKDEGALSEFQCLARQQIELFEATEMDVEVGARGRNNPIELGQVGIRCRHCSQKPSEERARAAVYFPKKLDLVYQTAVNMTSAHLCDACNHVPNDIRDKLLHLKEQRSGAGGGKVYWADGLRALGVIETNCGLQFTD